MGYKERPNEHTFCVAVAACTVVIRPSTMPKLSLITLARGARQLVVHDAFEITFIDGLNSWLFTPITNMGASGEGAEITTRLAPPARCADAAACCVWCFRRGVVQSRQRGTYLGEHTGGLHNVVSSSRPPGDLGRVLRLEHRDLLSVDHKLVSTCLNVSLEPTVHGVILEHVHHVVNRDEGVVHCNNICVGVVQGSPQDETSDTPESVDSNVHHFDLFCVVLLVRSCMCVAGV